MDIQSTRRIMLTSLIEEYGTIAKLAKEKKLDAGRLSQLKNGSTGFGEKAAREIELKTGKPVGWLDGAEIIDADKLGEKREQLIRFVLKMVQKHQIEQKKNYSPDLMADTVVAMLNLLLITTRGIPHTQLNEEELLRHISVLVPRL